MSRCDRATPEPRHQESTRNAEACHRLRTRRSASSIENERTADFSNLGCNSWSRVVGDAIRVARTGIARRVESWCGGTGYLSVDEDGEPSRTGGNVASLVDVTRCQRPRSMRQPGHRTREGRCCQCSRAIALGRTVVGDDLSRSTDFRHSHAQSDRGLLRVVVTIARARVVNSNQVGGSRR